MTTFDSQQIIVDEDESETCDSPQIEITEEQTYEPVICSAWKTSADFVNFIVASLRNVPPIHSESKNSFRRVGSYLKRIEANLIDGVENDAEYAELNEDQLHTLDICEQVLESEIDRIGEVVKNGFTKTATKSSRFTYTVQPFLFGIARVIINGVVSQGKSIESLFESLDKRFKLSEREKFELKFILNDMGYPIRSSYVDGIDMADQYHQ